ncbi:hypothetical protein [Gymnodinialimonas hymeniacidonis]|uniref:SH3 domain-containing protein n=1 Tax=Gymnodinialimonas hymeniacidonis TaxID=3126508 RepID=UPI0034C5C63C
MITRLTLSTGVFLLVSGAAQAQAYLCPGFGDVDVRITLIEGTDAAVAEFIAGADNPSGGGDPVTMRSQRGGDGITYAGGDLLLRGTGDIADLTSGDVSVHCTLEGAEATSAPVEQPVETVEETEIVEVPIDDGAGEATPDAAGGANIPAISLGGNLRAGPGTEFADVGGLDEGTEIILQADTGVTFNGYSWWEIILPSGEQAFQWGGVICVPGGGVSGVIEDGELCPSVDAETGVGEATADASGAADIAAISLGGNLRSGPGTAFPDIGGLEEGTAITLLANSGIPFNGYDWWEIELADGQIAFQWGGVICVPAGGVSGVLESCL